MTASRSFLCALAVVALVGASEPRDTSLVYKLGAQSGMRVLFSYGGAGSCPKYGSADGELKVAGPAGESATLAIWCGDGPILGKCQAIAPGPPMARKCTIDKVELTQGTFHCALIQSTKRVLAVESCDDP